MRAIVLCAFYFIEILILLRTYDIVCSTEVHTRMREWNLSSGVIGCVHVDELNRYSHSARAIETRCFFLLLLSYMEYMSERMKWTILLCAEKLNY